MDVLADDVRRRPYLVVIQFIVFGDDIRMHILRAVERVQAQHERLGRTFLPDRRHNVLPQRDDALLRELITLLVEHGVELYVRRLVVARIGGVVRRATSYRHGAPVPHRLHDPAVAATEEPAVVGSF